MQAFKLHMNCITRAEPWQKSTWHGSRLHQILLCHDEPLSRPYPAIHEPALGPADGAAEGDSAAEHSGKMGGGLQQEQPHAEPTCKALLEQTCDAAGRAGVPECSWE